MGCLSPAMFSKHERFSQNHLAWTKYAHGHFGQNQIPANQAGGAVVPGGPEIAATPGTAAFLARVTFPPGVPGSTCLAPRPGPREHSHPKRGWVTVNGRERRQSHARALDTSAQMRLASLSLIPRGLRPNFVRAEKRSVAPFAGGASRVPRPSSETVEHVGSFSAR